MTEEETWTRFDPLDVWCSACNASPGIRCVWQPPGIGAPPRSRQPHAARVSDARLATERARKRATQPPPGWSVPPPSPGST
jgi:hypothetical protein